MVSQLDTSIASSEPQFSPMIEGLIRVFTSAHRSFFTDVISQALQYAGQGNRVLVVQFLKGGIRQGSDRPVRLGQMLDWLRCDLPRYIDTPELDDTERNALQDLWNHTRSVIRDGTYRLIVLDELSLAIKFGLVAEAEVLNLLQTRPPHIDIVLTGPDMPESILAIADQITELRRMYSP
jgi:cob(I)alamin adenosyltransferase